MKYQLVVQGQPRLRPKTKDATTWSFMMGLGPVGAEPASSLEVHVRVHDFRLQAGGWQALVEGAQGNLEHAAVLTVLYEIVKRELKRHIDSAGLPAAGEKLFFEWSCEPPVARGAREAFTPFELEV